MKKCLCFFIALTILLSSLSFLPVSAAEMPAAGKVATNGYRLNVREKATTSSSVLAQLEDQNWITLLEKKIHGGMCATAKPTSVIATPRIFKRKAEAHTLF